MTVTNFEERITEYVRLIVDNDEYLHIEAKRFHDPDELQEWFEEVVCELTSHVAHEIAGIALSWVNWQELARDWYEVHSPRCCDCGGTPHSSGCSAVS